MIVKPLCADNFMVKFDMLLKVVAYGDVLHILPDFLRARVVLGPVRLPLPAILVGNTWDVACTSRISILKPSPSNVGVLLIDGEIDILRVCLYGAGKVDAGGSHTHENNFDASLFTHQRLLDLVLELRVVGIVTGRRS